MSGWISDQAEALQDGDDSLESLPSDLFQTIEKDLNALPNHPEDWRCLQSAIEQAIGQWQADPLAHENGIAVISNPTDTVARLLCSNLLAELDINIKTQVLQWTERPAVEKISQRLSQAFAREKCSSGSQSKPEIMVIPQLEKCFLRSIDGLDGIEYLRDTLLSDRSRFWILGVSKMSCQYLSKVFDLDAYCADIFTLPTLTGEQLKQ